MNKVRRWGIVRVNSRRTCQPMSNPCSSTRISTIIWPVHHRSPMRRRVMARFRTWATVQAADWSDLSSQWMPIVRWQSSRMALWMATYRMGVSAVMHGWEAEALVEDIRPPVLNHCSTRIKSINPITHSRPRQHNKGLKRMDSVEIDSSFRGCP